jgi:DNA polymerase I
VEEYREQVRAGKRGKAITYEIVIRKKLDLTKGDRVTYYITGSDAGANFDKGKLASEWNPKKPDQNVGFYLKRLDEIAQKFEPFFSPADYGKIFSVGGLFGFSPEGISVLREIQIKDTDEESEQVPF